MRRTETLTNGDWTVTTPLQSLIACGTKLWLDSVDPDEVARIEPALFTDMHARCTFCECPGPCAWDLAGDMDEAWRDGPDGWQAYCPNAEPLLALCEIPWFRPE